jgi:pyruvate kinase
MESTRKIPNVPLVDFKRTKIIATVGPSTNSYAKILALIKAGANGLRLNFSHGTHDEREQQIAWIRKASSEYGKPVAIIADLQGPKIRLGDFEGIITVQKGQALRFGYKANLVDAGIIPTQYDLSKKVKRGERIYLFDGKVQCVVTSVGKDAVVHAEAQNAGILIKRKGINLPDTDFGGDILTIKDKQDIAFATAHDVDYVALSFVQSSTDIRKLRTILHGLASDARIIAKVETRAALDDLEAIVEEADVVMVARGDLAIEATAEVVPLAQRDIIDLGMRYATPTIVATQMLASMCEAPEPTRAEVSDVATAVILGADCLMLSDETASGSNPIESVATMKRIVVHTQSHKRSNHTSLSEEDMSSHQVAVSAAVIRLAEQIGAKAIVAETASGTTALQLASWRPDKSIVAVTASRRVAQQLALCYGVKSYMRPIDKYAATKLTNWLRDSKVLKRGDMIVTASGQYPGVVGTTDTIKVRMLE